MQELIKSFDFKGHNVRTITNDQNQVFFVAKDVCDILGYTNSSKSITDHCKNEGITKMVIPNDSLGQGREQIIINESNLYRLVMRSKKKEAIDFQDWVCDEVLPSIRKTGKYEVKPKTQAELFLESAQMLVAQEQRLSAVESRILQIEAQTATRPEYFTVMGYAILSGVKVSLTLAAQIGKKAKSICLTKGYHIDKIRDPRFGQVGCYPTEVLKDVFNLTSFS